MDDGLVAGSAIEGHVVAGPVLDRRTVLHGAAALGVSALVATRHPFYRSQPAAAPSAVLAAAPTSATGRLALPMLSDGMNMDRPEYYETLQAGSRPQHRNRQSADLNGDGQDELVVRGPGGILAYVFDPDSGQWFSLPGKGPEWSDAKGWDQAQYYESIQTADIDGDGRAELLGLGPDGLEVWRYVGQGWVQVSLVQLGGPWGSSPWYSPTLQCGDIDGDGKAELVGRSSDGLHVWKWNGVSNWTALAAPAGFTDANLWFLPQYSYTIQLADIDGDGRAELLARGSGGMLAYKYTGSQWTELATLTAVSDAAGWISPASFPTLQCADIDGDGAAELIGLAPDGVHVWGYSATGWVSLPTLTALTAAGGWLEPQFGWTLQGADVDGDGTEELVARGAGGIRVWRLAGTGTGQWEELSTGPTWSDAAGWSHAQNFLTIQSARVSASTTNPNNGSPPAEGKAAVLLARSSTAVETWRLGPAGTWSDTSAPWPTIDAVTYAAISTFLGVGNANGIRALYNDLTLDIDLYLQQLKADPPPAPPAGYPEADSVWYDAVQQIATELSWVQEVQAWYGLERTLINGMFLGDAMSVDTVVAAMNAKVTNSSDVGLSVLSLLFNAAWAVLGAVEGAQVASAVAGVAAVVVQGVGTSWSGSTTLNTTLLTVRTDLEQLFDLAVEEVDNQLPRVTGGMGPDGGVIAGDYGLLQAMGRQILSGAAAWTWEQEDMDRLSVVGQRSYAVSVWQMLEPPSGWRWSVEPYQFLGDPELNTYYAMRATWDPGGGDPGGCQEYLMVQYATELGFLPKPVPLATPVLEALHGTASPDTVFPLGVPGTDVIRALHGWPQAKDTLAATNCNDVTDVYTLSASVGTSASAVAAGATAPLAATSTGGSTATLLPLVGGKGSGKGKGKGDAKKEAGDNPIPSTGVDLFVVTTLGRSPRGGKDAIVATVQVHNRGLSPAGDVEVLSAKLRGRRATGALPTRRRHIDDGESGTFHVHFVGVPGKTGQRVQLQLSGRYRGGTFSQNVQVTLP